MIATTIAHLWELCMLSWVCAGIVGLLLAGWKSHSYCSNELWKSMAVMTSLMITLGFVGRKFWVTGCESPRVVPLQSVMFAVVYALMYASTIVTAVLVYTIKPRSSPDCSPEIYWYAFVVVILNLASGLFIFPSIAYWPRA